MGHRARSVRRPPYLPFLSGPPDMVPNLKPIEEADWLLPDTEAPEWLEDKREILVRCRGEVLSILPLSEAACCEASRMIFDHLGVKNQYTMPTELEDAAANVSDDLCIMQQDENGDWCLIAASLCAPTYWSLREKIGQPLGGLHRNVPSGDPELAARIARIFSAIRPGQIMERSNWTVQAGPDRFTPDSAPLKLSALAMKPERAVSELYLRVERQTVRKLPRSGAVLFTIRICVDPLEAVLAAPGAGEALAHAWGAAHPEVARYKGWPVYERLMEYVLS